MRSNRLTNSECWEKCQKERTEGCRRDSECKRELRKRIQQLSMRTQGSNRMNHQVLLLIANQRNQSLKMVQRKRKSHKFLTNFWAKPPILETPRSISLRSPPNPKQRNLSHHQNLILSRQILKLRQSRPKDWQEESMLKDKRCPKLRN